MHSFNVIHYIGPVTGFIAVREMSGRNKISQGQGIVREFYRVSGKFWHLAKLMKNVMEFQTMSGKMTILDNMTLQSPRILTNELNRDLEILSNSLIVDLTCFVDIIIWKGSLILRYAL